MAAIGNEYSPPPELSRHAFVMQRVLIASLLLAACGSSHQLDDTPALDGGPAPDLTVPTLDGGSSPDGSVRPTSCTIEAGERLGEPCFCNGPLAYRDGFLYRQSVGIEVYAADGGELTPLGNVEERPSAQGGLIIANGHLVSLLDFAEDDENLLVYSLANPARPSRVGGFRLPHDAVLDLAATETQLVVASRSVDEASITWLDLTTPAEPVERWTVRTTGRPVSLALADAGAFVIEERGEAGETEQWLVWLSPEGSIADEHRLTGRRWNRAVVAHEGELFVSGPTTRTLERFSLGAGLTPEDSLATSDDSAFGGALLVRGEMAMLSNPMLVADLRAPMREVGLAPSPIGDMHHLAAPEGPLEWVYGSGGNGVFAARVSCE